MTSLFRYCMKCEKREDLCVCAEPVEPIVVSAGVRDSFNDTDEPVHDIECRFSDGQKFAAVTVDGQFPELANRIALFLNDTSVAEIEHNTILKPGNNSHSNEEVKR